MSVHFLTGSNSWHPPYSGVSAIHNFETPFPILDVTYNFLLRYNDTMFVLLNYNLYNFCFSHTLHLFWTDTTIQHLLFELQPIFCFCFQLSTTSLPSRSWNIWTTGTSTFPLLFNSLAPTFVLAIFPFPHHVLFPWTSRHFPNSLSHLASSALHHFPHSLSHLVSSVLHFLSTINFCFFNFSCVHSFLFNSAIIQNPDITFHVPKTSMK